MKQLLQLSLPMALLLMSCWGTGGGPRTPRSFSAGDKVKKAVQGSQGEIGLKDHFISKNLSRIYYYPPLILLAENSIGLHVINNSNPSQPQYVKFIKIPQLEDLAIKDRHLFVNHMADLVALELKADTIAEVQRLKNTFGNRVLNDDYPRDYRGYFICSDPDLGPVHYWKDTIVSQEPNCRIFK